MCRFSSLRLFVFVQLTQAMSRAYPPVYPSEAVRRAVSAPVGDPGDLDDDLSVGTAALSSHMVLQGARGGGGDGAAPRVAMSRGAALSAQSPVFGAVSDATHGKGNGPGGGTAAVGITRSASASLVVDEAATPSGAVMTASSKMSSRITIHLSQPVSGRGALSGFFSVTPEAACTAANPRILLRACASLRLSPPIVRCTVFALRFLTTMHDVLVAALHSAVLL